MKKYSAWAIPVVLLTLLAGCATPTAQVVEVEKPVVVEKTVIETVEVQKEVVVEKEVEKKVEVLVTATPTPKGGKLVVGQRQEPDNLDAHKTAWAGSVNVMMNIYDNLIFVNPVTKELMPWLAESWEASADGLTWTFKLRQGVTFHDGTPFNAEAVKFSFDRIMDPATASPFSPTFLGPYESTEVVDDYTVKVNFKEPFGAFLTGLAYSGFTSIVSPTAVEKYGADFGQNPVGTGPFMFKEWVPKDHITLVRNPDYNWAPAFYEHQGPAYLEEVTVKFVEEASTRVAVLETGEVDVIELVADQDVARLATDPRFRVIKSSVGGGPEQLFVNVVRPPTDDLKVRQAIEYAIDRPTISSRIAFNVSPVSYGTLSVETLCFDQNLKDNYPYPYDPEKAKAILEEAGWTEGADGIREKDGQKLVVAAPRQTLGAPYMELIQGYLLAVGIDMQIQEMAPGAYADANSRGEGNITHFGWVGEDPLLLSLFAGSATIPAEGKSGWNWTFLSDPALDAAIISSNKETDPAKRCDYVREAQQIIMQQAAVVPLYDIVQTAAMQAKVQNLLYHAQGYYRLLYDVWVQ